ncbi:TRAP transporter permease [Alkalilimnicola sp. S0819]|uniref:TRAP transporter permease n=1 Tax=Alkalilimnicola sp. S0819 TaxID=2613922 RepID=UPI001261C4E2|nr:TRAP transporter fused permease subunit [Alkalilimnicola sp. S0819]KAB7624001.1 TRAP transporter fused permease subunit [Alkalilimnicola sp. S0819]MPQ16608.1 TRAP transporter fused permease subunit [Alkalilimnicola sp. S0819]
MVTKAENGAVVASSARLRGPWLWLAQALLAAIPVFGMAYAFNITSYFGYAMWGQQAALAVLGLGLSATFLLKPAGSAILSEDGPGRPPLYDILLAALAVALCAQTAIRYEWLVGIGYLGNGQEYYFNMTAAALTLLLVIEALRRLTGWAMVILVLAALSYALVADKMPGAFQGSAQQVDFFLGFLHLDTSGILGTPLAVVVSTVIAYVLLGNALFRLGGGQIFLDLPLAAMGRYRGGSAKASVLASSLFGSISGSAVANVATTGIVTIPLMQRTGYKGHQAGAIEAVGSTGGQLLPPIMGAAAFIMAEFLGIPYTEVALAALLPAILFYMALLVQIHLHAARNGHRPLSREERPDAGATFKKHWPYLVPIVMLMVLLFGYRWRPEQAAFASLIAVIAAAAFVREHSIRPRALYRVLQGTGRSLLDIIAITAAAGIIVGVLSTTGLSFSLGLSIAEAAGSILIVLLVIAAVTAIVFGMGMPTTAVYVLMATLIAPALVAAGVEPLAAHLFVLYFGVLSMITPPVCLASFTAASMAGAPFMRTGWSSLRFGLVAFIVPFIFVASPSLLLQGEGWMETAIAFSTAVIGFLMLAAAVEGYLFGVIGRALRALSLVGGLLLIIPENGRIVPLGFHTDKVGLALALIALTWAWWQSRADRSGAAGAVKARG